MPNDKKDKQWGLVAILDALGASSYSDEEITRFLRSQEIVIALLKEKTEAILGEIKAERVSTFTFNDTVLILYRTEQQVTARDVKRFFTLLRKFTVDSLVNRVLFRGAIAIGSFYVNEGTNTVMGPAVTDAAAWYDRAEWIGIHATPHATIAIDSLEDYDPDDLKWVILNYEVPMKDMPALQLKVVNWPKAFFVGDLTPCAEGESPACMVRALLAKHAVPKGTEAKYFNTLEFFDSATKSLANKPRSKKASA
jgi:hypothetical protein